MRLLFACMLIIFSLAFVACDGNKKSIDTSGNITPIIQKHITIFGSENCDHCIEFRKKMDSVNLSYEFKDAEADEKYYNELMLLIQQANYKGYVQFPVIDVDDKIYVRPDFNEFLKLLE